MAPEILKILKVEEEEEIKEYSDKCDLWSIGVIIYELYFKKPPYNGLNASAMLKLIQNNGQKFLQKSGYDLLDNLIENLLIEDPIKRISWDEYFNHLFFKNEIKLIYKLEGKDEIKILGKQFIEKNKNKCYIIYKNKKYELKEYFKVEELNKNHIQIKK